jgi:hypothetical protein
VGVCRIGRTRPSSTLGKKKEGGRDPVAGKQKEAEVDPTATKRRKERTQ